MTEHTRGLDPHRWVDDHGDVLFRYALKRVRDGTLAEELVQETLVSAWASRDSFAGQSSERTWLVGILKHKVVDHFRRVARERQPKIDDEGPSEERWFDQKGKWLVQPQEWAVDPDQLLEQKAFWRVFEKCVTDLPERLAQAFTLREVQELSGAEVSKVLDVTATNLWVMLYRARGRLRTCLETNWLGSTGEEG